MMKLMKNFTTLTLCAAMVPAMTLGTTALADSDGMSDMYGDEQSQGLNNQDSDQSSTDWHRGDGEFMVSKPAGALYADEIIGKSITHRSSDDDVGEIQDLLIGDDGRIVGVVVKAGGFLGLGGQSVNLGWDQLQYTMEDDDVEFYTDMDEDMLQNAPSFERD